MIVCRLSPAEERYLGALHRLSPGEAAAEGVATSRLAEALGVSAPSVSKMLKRLQAMGYSIRGEGGGWGLSNAGREAARRLGDHHRLIAAYLVQSLGLSGAEAEREAETLEHHLSPALEVRLAAVLRGSGGRDGDPAVATDPANGTAHLCVHVGDRVATRPSPFALPRPHEGAAEATWPAVGARPE